MIRHLQQQHPDLALARLCELFGVSRAWYYACGVGETAARDVAVRDAVEAIIVAFPGYGYRRVTAQLRREGWRINHKRVLRIMREESLLCQLKRHFLVTTDANHPLPTYPNLVTGHPLDGLDQVWVADLTYIRLPGTFAYLAAILDAYSRRCIGWHLARTIDTRLTLAALDMALALRHPPPGLIHHSDRGIQYASHAYAARVQQAGLRPSMSARGNPYENAKAESFFKTLKTEEVYLNDYETFDQAEAHLDHFIGEVSNAKRLHSSLGYLPPIEFEANEQLRPIVDLPFTTVR